MIPLSQSYPLFSPPPSLLWRERARKVGSSPSIFDMNSQNVKIVNKNHENKIKLNFNQILFLTHNEQFWALSIFFFFIVPRGDKH